MRRVCMKDATVRFLEPSYEVSRWMSKCCKSSISTSGELDFIWNPWMCVLLCLFTLFFILASLIFCIAIMFVGFFPWIPWKLGNSLDYVNDMHFVFMIKFSKEPGRLLFLLNRMPRNTDWQNGWGSFERHLSKAVKSVREQGYSLFAFDEKKLLSLAIRSVKKSGDTVQSWIRDGLEIVDRTKEQTLSGSIREKQLRSLLEVLPSRCDERELVLRMLEG